MVKSKKRASKPVQKSKKRSNIKIHNRYIWMGLGIIAVLLIGIIVWVGVGKPKGGEAWAAPGRVCSSYVPCSSTQYGSSGQTTKWCRQSNRGTWTWMWCAKCGTSSACSNSNLYATSFSYGQTARCENLEYICDDDNSWAQCNSVNAAANKIVQIVGGDTTYTLKCSYTDGYYKWVQVSTVTKQPILDLTPDSKITAYPTSGNTPLTSGIHCSATGGDSPLSYKLMYGDGQSISGTSGISQNHAYTAAGTFTATCTVTDVDGDYDSSTVTITTTTKADCSKEAYPCSSERRLWCSASYTRPDSTYSGSFSFTKCADDDNDGCLEITIGRCDDDYGECTGDGNCPEQQ